MSSLMNESDARSFTAHFKESEIMTIPEEDAHLYLGDMEEEQSSSIPAHQSTQSHQEDHFSQLDVDLIS